MNILRVGFGLLALGACAVSGSAQFSLTSTSYTQDFNSIGTSSTATLPDGWGISNLANYTSLTTATTQAAGTSGAGILTGTSSGGAYNFANGINASSTDRAVGFLSSGSYTSPRYLYFAFTNDTGATITSLTINFDIEKYRSGTRAFDFDFATATNTSSWTTHASASQSFAADANNTTISNPPLVTAKTLTLTGLDLLVGSTYYLRWSYTGSGGSTNAQGLAIDNLSITAVTAIPEPSTYAAIFGALALAGVMIHRRRKQA